METNSQISENTDEQEAEEKLDVLTFDGDIKNHIKLLLNVPEAIFKDFCWLTLNFMINGDNVRRYKTAAEKLNTSVTNITNAVYGIAYILINCCKYNLNEKDFYATLSNLEFSETNKTLLIKFLIAKKDEIRNQINKFNKNLPMFNNLEWRLQCTVASRICPDQAVPSVLLDFSILNNENFEIYSGKNENEIYKEPAPTITHKLLQCDIQNLDNIISNLETALKETKNYHAKNIKTAVSKE